MGRSNVLEVKPQGGWDPGKGKVLLVDEDLGELELYSGALAQLGYEVRAFCSYRDAADCVSQEVFDLALVSQGSSHFEGRDVVACIMEKDRRIPVIVLTRSIDVPCYAEAMQLGARDYLKKPLPHWELQRLVARYVRSRPGSA